MGELALKELDRRGSSCPTLFAWDGKQYQFVSDVIGAAVVGHWVSPTATNQNDPDEWIKVDGDKLQARNGLLSLRFGEPMEEVNYIDQLRLVAVDHPAGTEVYPDERFLNEPPFASGKTVAVAAPRPVAGAWDDDGRDVRELLAEQGSSICAGLHESELCGVCEPAHADAGCGGVVGGEAAAVCCWMGISSTSAPARCMRRGRRGCSRFRRVWKRRCRTAAGSGSSTTWDFRRACRGRLSWI